MKPFDRFLVMKLVSPPPFFGLSPMLVSKFSYLLRIIPIFMFLLLSLGSFVSYDDFHYLVVQGKSGLLCSCGMEGLESEIHFAYIQLLASVVLACNALLFLIGALLKQSKGKYFYILGAAMYFLQIPIDLNSWGLFLMEHIHPFVR